MKFAPEQRSLPFRRLHDAGSFENELYGAQTGLSHRLSFSSVCLTPTASIKNIDCCFLLIFDPYWGPYISKNKLRSWNRPQRGRTYRSKDLPKKIYVGCDNLVYAHIILGMQQLVHTGTHEQPSPYGGTCLNLVYRDFRKGALSNLLPDKSHIGANQFQDKPIKLEPVEIQAFSNAMAKAAICCLCKSVLGL